MTAPASTSTVELAPQPPTNLDAEETVVGALLLAGAQNTAAWVDKVRETGLQPLHFYRPSLGQLYGLIVELADHGQPFDPISVAAKIPAGSDVDVQKVHELAALVPAVSNVAHHAGLILETHQRRQAWATARKLEQAALAGPIPTELAAELQQLLDDPAGQRVDLRPLWFDQALAEPIPDTNEYVDGVLERGVLADIVGLPYLHKSAIALELAVKVAKGRGMFLGKYAIKQKAKVAYYWADDSRPQELKRIQSYAAANDLEGRGLDIGFYLNPGITLPDDLPAVKRQVREHGYGLVVFDSLYNFADFDFVKDTGAVKHLYTALKRMCDEIEGLTIVLVDHGSKPSDSNRDRDDSIASYGSVWKAAAVRSSIVVTKKGHTLFVSATGNNVKGFPRTPAYFNQERLEVSLAEENEADPKREENIELEVLEYVRRNPGKSTRQITDRVKGRRADVASAVRRLEEKNLILNTYGTASQLPGTHPDALSGIDLENASQNDGTRKHKTAWIPLEQAEKPRPDHDGTHPDAPRPAQVPEVRPETRPEEPLYVVEGSGIAVRHDGTSTTEDHERAPSDETLAPDEAHAAGDAEFA